MLTLTQSMKCIKKLITQNVRSYRQLVDILPEVELAIKNNNPIVALESTIITHGMPYPQNFETACEVENLVRKQGAIPATIAIVNGRIKVGLSQTELKQLSLKNQKEVIKCSRRDLPYVLAKNECGGTTVAGTMIIANMVGLRVFATGGIGGVHREGNVTMDISADLIELGRTPIALVCSGVKSILDIPKTLEYLETMGVCTISYNSTDGMFPDFYTRNSGCKAPYNINTPNEAARMITTLHAISLKSGILVGVPIPKEFEADKQVIDAAIKEAYDSAKAQNISGKEITPFLLDSIAKITSGSSLQANMALIKNNASIAAQISKELCDIESMKGKNFVVQSSCKAPAPIIIGASILDLALTISEELPEVLDGATYNTHVKYSAGGVGRNLAEGIHKLYGNVQFLSVVGGDHIGKTLLHLMPKELQNNIKIDIERATSLCSVIFDKIGDCKLILGNMEIHNNITPELIQEHEIELSEAPIVIIDANLPLSTLECVLKLAQKYDRPVFFEPTDMRIACKPFSLSRSLTQQIKIISPNIYELKAIVERLSGQKVQCNPRMNMDTSELLRQVKLLVLAIQEFFDCILVTLGPHGVLLSVRSNETADFRVFHQNNYEYGVPKNAKHIIQFYAAPKVQNLKNVSGAGDSFSSGFITGLLRHYEIERAIALGFIAAERALKISGAVPNVYFENDKQQQDELKRRVNQLYRQTI